MPYLENPFTPTFGEKPLVFAGRKSVIDAMIKAFDSSRRRPDLTTIFTGARGTGKTSLLSLVAEEAEQRGWIAVSVTALPGMLNEIEEETINKASHLLEKKSQLHLSSIGIPQIVNIDIDDNNSQWTSWRLRMNQLLDSLNESETGLLITVDEVDSTLEEMVRLAAVYQHFIREERKVALLMAGLPGAVSQLVNDKTVSFLRRSQMIDLGMISDREIGEAFSKTVHEAGRTIDGNALRKAIDVIGGYPFLMQLIGYRAWEINPENREISASDVDLASVIATEEIRDRILEPTYRSLSDNDIAFAKAMLEDADESLVKNLEERLGWSASQISQYRRRLIKLGVIGTRRRGSVGFDLPMFREFLAEK